MNIDEELLDQASKMTGISEKTMLVQTRAGSAHCTREREAAGEAGGQEKQLKDVPEEAKHLGGSR